MRSDRAVAVASTCSEADPADVVPASGGFQVVKLLGPRIAADLATGREGRTPLEVDLDIDLEAPPSCSGTSAWSRSMRPAACGLLRHVAVDTAGASSTADRPDSSTAARQALPAPGRDSSMTRGDVAHRRSSTIAADCGRPDQPRSGPSRPLTPRNPLGKGIGSRHDRVHPGRAQRCRRRVVPPGVRHLEPCAARVWHIQQARSGAFRPGGTCAGRVRRQRPALLGLPRDSTAI
jgi:hypothetical protein